MEQQLSNAHINPSFSLCDYQFSQLNLVSTALTNFLPQLPVDIHSHVYQNILINKQKSAAVQFDVNALNLITPEGYHVETMKVLRNKPAIICTYHTGSYRLLNLYLAHHNIAFDIVLSKRVLKYEEKSLMDNTARLTDKNDKICVRYIPAEDPNALLHMFRSVKEGRSLVMYIDGNTGGGTNTSNNPNNCVVSFLGSKLYARKGIAFLAARLQVPLLSVANYITCNNNMRMRFFKPTFVPNTDSNIANHTQELYDNIATIVSLHPEQWEAWLYIHKVAIPKTELSSSPNHMLNFEEHQRYSFNRQGFGIINHEGDCFLIDKSTYAFYRINKSLYSFLKSSFYDRVIASCLESHVANDLVSRGVLIRA